MKAEIVKKGQERLSKVIPLKLPTMGWYFTDSPPPHAIIPESRGWSCIFALMQRAGREHAICFSAGHTGCSGASCYMGFTTPSPAAGSFLAEKEKFKKSVSLGNAFYQNIHAEPAKDKFLVFTPLALADDAAAIEVITLWTDAVGITGLTTLANYDRATNEKVITPFASGCQSTWTIPYKEGRSDSLKAVIGCTDPAVRRYLPSAVLSFSVPANRFVEMTENISGSFLEEPEWANAVRPGINSGAESLKPAEAGS